MKKFYVHKAKRTKNDGSLFRILNYRIPIASAMVVAARSGP